MGYRSNSLDGPMLMTGPKTLLIKFGIHNGLESCTLYLTKYNAFITLRLILGIPLTSCSDIHHGMNCYSKADFHGMLCSSEGNLHVR